MCGETPQFQAHFLARRGRHHLQPGTQTPPQAQVTYKLGGPECFPSQSKGWGQLRALQVSPQLSATPGRALGSYCGEALRGRVQKQVQGNLRTRSHPHPKSSAAGEQAQPAGPEPHTPERGRSPGPASQPRCPEPTHLGPNLRLRRFVPGSPCAAQCPNSGVRGHPPPGRMTGQPRPDGSAGPSRAEREAGLVKDGEALAWLPRPPGPQ